jgi:hypothetical protein
LIESRLGLKQFETNSIDRGYFTLEFTWSHWGTLLWYPVARKIRRQSGALGRRRGQPGCPCRHGCTEAREEACNHHYICSAWSIPVACSRPWLLHADTLCDLEVATSPGSDNKHLEVEARLHHVDVGATTISHGRRVQHHTNRRQHAHVIAIKSKSVKEKAATDEESTGEATPLHACTRPRQRLQTGPYVAAEYSTTPPICSNKERSRERREGERRYISR